MAKNKLTIDFNGFEHIKKQLDAIGGEVTKTAVDDALKASQLYISEQVSAAITPHTLTGQTKRSIIKDHPVEWTGDVAAVDVGFDIIGGGLPSIFLMYGTQLHGQPHIEPDRKLYEAVYGSKTRKEVLRLQEQAFNKALERVIRDES